MSSSSPVNVDEVYASDNSPASFDSFQPPSSPRFAIDEFDHVEVDSAGNWISPPGVRSSGSRDAFAAVPTSALAGSRTPQPVSPTPPALLSGQPSL
eukprot:12458553-Alexandrium_andersonii.AAC.1